MRWKSLAIFLLSFSVTLIIFLYLTKQPNQESLASLHLKPLKEDPSYLTSLPNSTPTNSTQSTDINLYFEPNKTVLEQEPLSSPSAPIKQKKILPSPVIRKWQDLFNIEVGANYSNQFGPSVALSVLLPLQKNKIALLGDFDIGKKEDRESLTLSYQLNPSNRAKITGERLRQNILLDFQHQAKRYPVKQYGSGILLEHLFHHSLIHSGSLKAYFVAALSDCLPELTINNSPYVRYIAGGRLQSYQANLSLIPFDKTKLDLSLNYDDLYFDTLLSNPNDNRKRTYGVDIRYQFPFNHQYWVDLSTTQRGLYSQYNAELLSTVKGIKSTNYRLALQGTYTKSKINLPSEWRIALNAQLLLDSRGIYRTDFITKAFEEWAKEPVFRMPQVLVKKEESVISAFSPATLTVLSEDPFTSTAILPGEDFEFSIYSVPGSTQPAPLPPWVHVKTEKVKDGTRITLYGLSPTVSERTNFYITVKSRETSCHKQYQATFELDVLARNDPFTLHYIQSIHSDMPYRFALTSENLLDGQYIFAPEPYINQYFSQIEIEHANGHITGNYEYRILAADVPLPDQSLYVGMGCSVNYDLDENNILTLNLISLQASGSPYHFTCMADSSEVGGDLTTSSINFYIDSIGPLRVRQKLPLSRGQSLRDLLYPKYLAPTGSI